jgi:hypothetical protein
MPQMHNAYVRHGNLLREAEPPTPLPFQINCFRTNLPAIIVEYDWEYEASEEYEIIRLVRFTQEREED